MKINKYKPAYIDMSVVCCHCGDLLWTGAYEPSFIGRLKKKMRKNGWVYRQGEGTVCQECASKPFYPPSRETNVSDADSKKILKNIGIGIVENVGGKFGKFVSEPTEPQITISITCLHCESVLWHGMYEKGIIGRLKKLIKQEHWIHHPDEGTLCSECAKEYL